MQIINANVPLFLSTVENHHVIKDEILSAISSSGKYSVDKKEFKLQHTDWHLNREESRPYWSIIANNVFKHLEEVAAKFNVVNGNVVNYWVQQYGKDDFHTWHTHGNCMFSSIYYVELPNKTETKFRVFKNEFCIPVKEGDILTFPSCIEHCSPKNKSESQKTVIAFNFNVGY